MEKKERSPELQEWLDSKYTQEIVQHLKDARENLNRCLVDPFNKDMMSIYYCRAGIEQCSLILYKVENMQ